MITTLSSSEILLSTAIIFIGLIIRSIKTNLILNDFKTKSIVNGIGTMGFAYFIDLIIPLKIGQILRIYMFNKLTNIGILRTAVLVLVEKVIDIVFIAIVSLYLLLILNNNFNRPEQFLIIFAGLIIILLLVIFTYLINRKNRLTLRMLWRLSRILDDKHKNIFIKEVLNIIIDLRIIMKNKYRITIYFTMAIISWMFTIYGVLILLNGEDINNKISQILIKTSYLFDYEYTIITFIQFSAISLIGLLFGVTFFNKKLRIKLYYDMSDGTSNININSDFKTEDQFVYFMDKKSQLIDKIKLEGSRNVKILEVYPGGSQALTLKIMKINSNSEIQKTVRKIIGKKDIYRLQNQIRWINEKDHKRFPKVIDISENKEYKYYDMEFIDELKAFDYLHLNKDKDLKPILVELFEFLKTDVYIERKNVNGNDFIINYIKKNIQENLQIISTKSNKLSQLIETNKNIYVNGQKMMNLNDFYSVITGIEHSKKYFTELTVTKNCHGDLTIDNMFVNKENTIILIDPSDDNMFSSPIIDLSRILQSFEGAHELINLGKFEVSTEVSEDSIRINTIDYTTSLYEELGVFVREKILPEFVSKKESKLINLFISTFFIRMIVHNMDNSYERFLIYYSKALLFAHKYIEETDFNNV